MRIVVQRVCHCSVSINGKEKSSINQGMLILLGIGHEDGLEDINYLIKKIINLRIFDDETGKPNRSIIDIGGQIMLVSQFTLMASTQKGNRPSYINAARPEVALPTYNLFVDALQQALGKPIATGTFGADMQVSLQNDGPITIIIDSKSKTF